MWAQIDRRESLSAIELEEKLLFIFFKGFRTERCDLLLKSLATCFVFVLCASRRVVRTGFCRSVSERKSESDRYALDCSAVESARFRAPRAETFAGSFFI